MITEAGFALCAANISILYGMFNMTNGPQKVKQSIRSLFSFRGPYEDSAIGPQRYRERLGSQGSDSRIAMDAARSKRSGVNVELLAMQTDDGSRSNSDVGRGSNMV